MNAAALGGRQMQRSAASGHHHHQRQYSDHFVFEPAAASTAGGGSGSAWHQSAGLQHLPASQQVDYFRMLRSMQRGVSGDFLSTEPSTPPVCSRSSSMRKNGDGVSPSELSPGILDLHSFNTELLPKIPVNGAGAFGHARVRSFDDTDSTIFANKLTSKPRPVPENNLVKNFSVDKEKSGSVAKIKVVVRKRPLNKKEISKKEEDIITTNPNSNSVTVHETKLKVDLTEYVEKHEFVFDAVLDEDVSNDEVYRETVEPIIPTIFQRTKATCFAYGQTGSGKTYTMQPLPLKASHDILRLMHHTFRNQGFQLFVSFFEIYGGKLFDLLNDRRKLCMREDGKQQVCIVGLQEYRVSDVETIRELIGKGNATRSTGTTGANEESSRSHAILQLAIKRLVDGNESKPARLVGKLSFIDLAGSERGADTTDNDKLTRIEGAEINKSLLALKECIRALDNDQIHIPFRGSKLTEVLRDSFIGNSRTVMISCISPNSGSCEHTLNTLRYADRVKSLSKGNNQRKDLSSAASNLTESTILLEDASDVGHETNKFGWSKPVEKEPILPSIDRATRGEAPTFTDHSKDQRGRSSKAGEQHYYPGESYEQGKLAQKGNPDKNAVATSEDRRLRTDQPKWKNAADLDPKGLNSDDDLNALLKEEEYLVIAHRRQVEETIDIVKEEMRLLFEADQPGKGLDEYISRLNAILSQKAAGIVDLQMRLANFQRLLNENNVLLSSVGT
uniref:Kinesin-like protein n=1 Tax=Anthurium amnicola TaxID=1678845 RepID=A0A1D1XFU5_9ARAE